MSRDRARRQVRRGYDGQSVIEGLLTLLVIVCMGEEKCTTRTPQGDEFAVLDVRPKPMRWECPREGQPAPAWRSA